MQNKEETHQLTNGQITELLINEQVGTLATFGSDGYPHAVPVHFVYYNNNIYFHGRSKGQKLDNIRANPKVCFEVYKMKGLLFKDDSKSACTISTEYASVVIKGTAKLITDFNAKKEMLYKIVSKYVPHFAIKPMPEESVNKTVLIEISISECMGRYNKYS